MKISLRSLGGVAGVLAALAGGIGAAVGFYSLPDPTAVAVGQGVYARVDERAIAVVFQDNGDGTIREVRIDAGRGGSGGTDASAGGAFPSARGSQNAGLHFSATMATCRDGECYDWQEYHAEPWEPMVFDIDPLLRTASFSGYVQGCQFDITWTGEGEIAPFAGIPNLSTGVAPWNTRTDLTNGYAETSRVAPADIVSCFGSFSDANGYLSRGVRRVLADAEARIGE